MSHRVISGGVAWVAVLAACATGASTTNPPPTGETSDTSVERLDTCAPYRWTKESCTSGIRGDPFPAVGADAVSPWPTIVAEMLTDESRTARFELYEGERGRRWCRTEAPIPLADVVFTEDGKAAHTRPLAPLAPDTLHTLFVDLSCDKTAVIPFTTADIGTPVESPQVVGTTYALDLGAFDVLQPPRMGQLLSALLTGVEDTLLFAPTAVEGQGIVFEVGTGHADGPGPEATWTQRCDATATLSDGDGFAQNPFVELADRTVPIQIRGATLMLEDVRLTGAFRPDGRALVGVGLSARFDTRPLVPVLPDDLRAGSDDDAVCNLVLQFTGGTVGCIPCPDDGPKACLELDLVNATAPRVDLALQPISPAEAAAGCAAD